MKSNVPMISSAYFDAPGFSQRTGGMPGSVPDPHAMLSTRGEIRRRRDRADGRRACRTAGDLPADSRALREAGPYLLPYLDGSDSRARRNYPALIRGRPLSGVCLAMG